MNSDQEGHSKWHEANALRCKGQKGISLIFDPPNGDYDYVYDPIGNRNTFTLDSGTATTYADNSLNQYTATSGGQAESFSYDDDGNLTGDDTFTYVWDCGTLDTRLRQRELIALEGIDR